MHSHDRTLLARLGFQDPDRKNADHDLACQYLAETEQATRLANALCPVLKSEQVEWEESRGKKVKGVLGGLIIGKVSSALETPVSKGDGKFKTTIGFLDVKITYKSTRPLTGERQATWEEKSTGSQERISVNRSERDSDRSILVEVKWGPVPISDILRQINLYREYIEDPYIRWATVTRFGISAINKETLERAGIRHFYLSTGYDEWKARRAVDGAYCESGAI